MSELNRACRSASTRDRKKQRSRGWVRRRKKRIESEKKVASGDKEARLLESCCEDRIAGSSVSSPPRHHPPPSPTPSCPPLFLSSPSARLDYLTSHGYPGALTTPLLLFARYFVTLLRRYVIDVMTKRSITRDRRCSASRVFTTQY